MRILAVAAIVGSFIGGGLLAQTAPSGEAVEILSTGGLASSLLASPVTNEPFSAVQTVDTTKTLMDGTKVTHQGHHTVFRDSEGRVRVEQRMSNAKNGKPEIKMVYVKDPVAHTLTVWMVNGPGKPVASVSKLPGETKNAAMVKVEKRPVQDASRLQPVITRQEMGSKMFDNVMVTDKLTTTIVPAGRSGNDQPITKTHEVWTSQEMQLVLKQRDFDPRRGERIVQLADFSRAEPDAALFRPPAGYEVKSAMKTLQELLAKLAAAQE